MSSDKLCPHISVGCVLSKPLLSKLIFLPCLSFRVSFLPLPPFPPCFVINFCPCPCPRFWYFCPLFSGAVFALAPISSMLCHQCLPLPLPSQLPFRVMARARARANIGGKTWGKWGQGQKRGQNHKLLECPHLLASDGADVPLSCMGENIVYFQFL